METPLTAECLALMDEIKIALRADETDRGEALVADLTNLHGMSPDDERVLVFTVTIAIQRGQARDALRLLNSLGEDHSPGLRAICLRWLREPIWQGLATEVLENPATSDHMRLAMQHLLGKVDAFA